MVTNDRDKKNLRNSKFNQIIPTGCKNVDNKFVIFSGKFVTNVVFEEFFTNWWPKRRGETKFNISWRIIVVNSWLSALFFGLRVGGGGGGRGHK
jgi:hypothetical protein